MAGFTYENGLPHQENGVAAVLRVFDRATLQNNGRDENPQVMFSGSLKADNLKHIQCDNGIADTPLSGSHVLDIAMETGTGKTYTYTKTMFELHRQLGIFKFIVLVPTLSIKAGTKNFLQSSALATHFRLDFQGLYGDTEIALYVVESQKAAKGKKSSMPSEIVRFVQAEDKRKIHVLLINAGMLNSDTLAGKTHDGSVLIKDKFHVPMEALASVRPFVMVDEPHKFPKDKKTWENVQKLNAQFILRYGATFNGAFENLIYRLSAVDAFNQDLVKGIRAFTEQIDGDNGERVKLLDLRKEPKEAVFMLGKREFRLQEGDDLGAVHQAIEDLRIEKFNTSTLVLSNGVEMKKGNSINPFSYHHAVRDKMMRQAIRQHFVLEQQLLTRQGGRIKPLTLFFIDDIAGYRDEANALSGSLKQMFEQMLQAELERCLKTETDPFLRDYWQTALNDISQTHGGYFSQDNSDKDEKIEQQVHEILHDKEALLSLANPRRFIFSKWTLREGWDNPNVFQICKLRSSGSETSKLQEVGRGLRLPVNEYMARVKDHAFFLNYFVDSSEQDFVQSLCSEVNQSVAQVLVFDSLSDELIAQIQAAYPDETKKSIRAKLVDLTDDDENFVENGFAQAQALFPQAFSVSGSLKNGKIIRDSDKPTKVKMRVGKYDELKTLWETINQKALLQYKIADEAAFQALFERYLRDNAAKFTPTQVRTVQQEIRVEKNGTLVAIETGSLNDEIFEPIITLNYREFLLKFAQTALIQMQTLHKAFVAVRDVLDIGLYLNEQTIKTMNKGFNDWLLLHSFSAFEVGYSRVGGSVHPTKFTDENGSALTEVNAADLGTQFDKDSSPLAQFLFDSVFYDSGLERENITGKQVQEVVVFTKIPKNSIKIPVAGGKTYSPDFAYIVKTDKGETLNLVLESKNVSGSESLRREEQQKIKHAERLFDDISRDVNVVFQTQFEGEKIARLLREMV